jgi:protoheme IX farnesyltransferase
MDYVALTKPRIVAALLLTAMGGMFAATGGLPDLSLVVAVVVGGSLGAGGAQALNHYLDRDIDAVMTRTRRRPVAAGRISPQRALVFGVLLNVAAFIVLSSMANTLSAVLTLSATLFYVLVYTMGLKRSTPQNIVIGGAAGAMPPMVGWAAVTGDVGLAALYMFAIVFFWTPPHFWALALLIKDDYARAGVPMLPVVAGVAETKLHIFLYTLMLVALSVLFFATGTVGWFYLGTATVLGAPFVYYAWRLLRQPGDLGARALYQYSLAYLALLFAGIAVDSILAVQP